MKFLIVFALFTVITYVAAAPAAGTIIAAYESFKYGHKNPTTTIGPSFTPQGVAAYRPHRNTLIAAAGALITKLVKNVPKAI